MSELKMLKASQNEGIVCHYISYLFPELIIPISYNSIPILVYCNGQYISLIEEGYIWCDSFRYEMNNGILTLKADVKI